MDELEQITMSGELVSLAELAGIDLEGVTEKRALIFPVGQYQWEIIADPDPPKIQKIGDKGGVVFNLKCLNVFQVKDPAECPNGNPAELIGKTHRETMFLTTMDSLGYLKAFIVDVGGKGKGALKDLLVDTVGLKFTAPITHRSDKDDKDKIYVNVNRNKLIPEVKAAA